LKILYIYADTPQEWNCSQHNCINPMEAINKAGVHKASSMHTSQFIENSEETQRIVSDADIVIVERNLFQDCLTAMMFWKVRGQNFATIFDDGYHCMHKHNVSYEFWQNGQIKFKDAEGKDQIGYMKPHPLEQLKWGIAMTKGLQTVSQALCDYWKPVNDTYLIHNHLVFENYLNIEPLYKHEGDIWIGWTGSLSHMDSFESSGLLRAFKKVARFNKNVRILISGDKRIFDLVDVPLNKKIFSPFVPKEKYPALIKSLDICTIPLAGEYDKCRSQIKPLECLALKVPFLATDFPNYNHLAPYGNFTENGWQKWEEKINDMIQKLPEYKERAVEVGYPFAETQNINLHVDERINLYKLLIDKPYK
jgi:hypothetical protein